MSDALSVMAWSTLGWDGIILLFHPIWLTIARINRAIAMLIFPEQCRAARGLLNWSQENLALAAGVSRSTIKDFEAQRHCLQRSSEKLLVETFDSAGVELLIEGSGRLGVRFKR